MKFSLGDFFNLHSYCGYNWSDKIFRGVKLRFDKLCHGSSEIRDDSELCLFFPERCTLKMKMHHSWSDESGINKLSRSYLSIQIHHSNLFLIYTCSIMSRVPPCGAVFWKSLLQLISMSVLMEWYHRDANKVLRSWLTFDRELCRHIPRLFPMLSKDSLLEPTWIHLANFLPEQGLITRISQSSPGFLSLLYFKCWMLWNDIYAYIFFKEFLCHH